MLKRFTYLRNIEFNINTIINKTNIQARETKLKNKLYLSTQQFSIKFVKL